MSGYANYSNLHSLVRRGITVIRNRNNVEKWLSGIGNLIRRPEPLRIKNMVLADGSTVIPDPTPAQGLFEVYWKGDISHAVNNGIEGGVYNVAFREENWIVTGEINHHPDSSQYFIPWHNHPYYMILARPGFSPSNLIALRLQGVGVHIDPGVWHQPPILDPSVEEEVKFLTCQLRSHNCVLHDAMESDGELYSFELKENLK